MDKLLFKKVLSSHVLKVMVFDWVHRINIGFKQKLYKWENLLVNPHILASYGYLDQLKSYFKLYGHYIDDMSEYFQSFFGYTTIKNAIVFGHLEIIKYIVEELNCDLNSLHTNTDTDCIGDASRCGRLDFIHYLEEHGGTSWDYCSALKLAPFSLNLEILEHMFNRVNSGLGTKKSNLFITNSNVFDNAAQVGRIDFIEWLTDRFPEDISSNMHYISIIFDHFDMLQYLVERPQTYPPPREDKTFFDFTKGIGYHSLLDCAVQLNKLDMAKYLLSKGQRFYSADIIEGAIRNKNMDAMNWVLQNTTWGYTANSTVIAAEAGNIQILEHLLKENVAFTPECIDLAAYKGDIKVLEWLRMNTTAGCTRNAFSHATYKGNFETLKWLYSHFRDHFDEDLPWMDEAAKNGRLEELKWLHQNKIGGFRHSTIYITCSNGHAEILKWIHENRTEQFTSNDLDKAVYSGNLKLITWLHENRSEGFTHAAMRYAAQLGHIHIMKFLHENRTEGCTAETLCVAVKKGDLYLIDWLKLNRTEFQ